MENVSSDSRNGNLVLRMKFKHPLEEFHEPVFYKKSVQIDFPRATIQPAKRSFPTGDPLVSQVYVTQTDPRTLRAHFLFGENFYGLGDKFKWQKQGRYLVVRVQKEAGDILEQLLDRAAGSVKAGEEESEPATPLNLAGQPALSNNPPSQSSLRKVSLPVSTKAGEAGPVDAQQTQKRTRNTAKKNSPLKLGTDNTLELGASGFRMLMMLSLVLGLMFLLFYLFKKFVLKNTPFGGGESLVRVLATGFLGPKKNIAIVEVAGEVLVLGISNDNITLLTTIGEEERIEQIRKAGKEGGFGKFWTRPGKRTPKTVLEEKDLSNSSFSEYLQQFSTSQSRDQTVEDVKTKIRENLAKVRMV